ncbi:protein shisa-5-like, partial [Poecilia reticulata]|uniref:protein shisa-5-like n=1 Tax=Poecilia reticulata TaxID=8081 RepID=UPI0004A2E364
MSSLREGHSSSNNQQPSRCRVISLVRRFMAVMVSSVWVRVLCIFCLIELPERSLGFSHFGDDQIIIAIIVGVILFITCVCLIICFCSPCCCFYKLCRKPPNQRQTVVTNMPQPHYSPSGSQAQPPDYQAVAGDEGSTAPATPPPSYMESTSPWYPTPFVPGQAMYSLSPPNQPSAPPLPSDEIDLP